MTTDPIQRRGLLTEFRFLLDLTHEMIAKEFPADSAANNRREQF
jgi:hypothetical protein